MKKLCILLIAFLMPPALAADTYKQTLSAPTTGVALLLNSKSKYMVQPWDGAVCVTVTCSATLTVTCLSSGPGVFVPTKSVYDTGKLLCPTPYLQVMGDTATVQVKVNEVIN